MKEILLEVFKFIESPNDQRIENWTFKKNIKYIIYILCFELLINILIFVPLIYLLDKVEPILHEPRIDYKRNTLIQVLIVTAIFSPIAEEFIFRYLLRYNELFSKLINRSNWNFVFKFLVYISILLFGFVHSSNFENSSILFYCILPILVASQLIGGVFLAFLRVRFNITSSIIAHFLWNALITITPLITSIFEKPYEKVTEKYTLKIEYLNYSTKKSQKFEIDSISGKMFKAEIEEYSINHILDYLYQYKRERNDYLVNIKLESQKGLTKEDFKVLLLEYDKNEIQ
jgi:membrane protease YdiL (CAAX protease family)